MENPDATDENRLSNETCLTAKKCRRIILKTTIKNNVSWVGYIDWELESFHGDEYSILNGSSQNAYLIQEEKTVLIDTVWAPHHTEYIENLKAEINLQDIDFIVANHGEVDHSGALSDYLGC